MSINSHTMMKMQCYFHSRLEVLSKRSEYDGGLALARISRLMNIHKVTG